MLQLGQPFEGYNSLRVVGTAATTTTATITGFDLKHSRGPLCFARPRAEAGATDCSWRLIIGKTNLLPPWLLQGDRRPPLGRRRPDDTLRNVGRQNPQAKVAKLVVG